MPCYDSRDHVSYEDLEKAREEGLEFKKLLDERTAMLCEAMRIIEDGYRHLKIAMPSSIMTPKLYQWWEGHKKWDAQRAKNETAKSSVRVFEVEDGRLR